MAATSKLNVLRQVMSSVVKGPGFDRVLSKLTMVEASNGRCVCELKLSEEHQNRGGMMHGGLTCTLVDVVSTSALMANDGTAPGVSVDLNVSFIRAAKVGEEIVIDAKTIKLGKTLAFLTVEIKNKSDSKIIATGSHTKYIGG